MMQRMCIICRGKALKTRSPVSGDCELIRLVMRGNEVVVDRNQVEQTRGAYIHSTVQCVSRLAQIGKLARALRISEGAFSGAQVASLTRDLLSELTKVRDVGTGEGTATGKGGLGQRSGHGPLRMGPKGRNVRL